LTFGCHSIWSFSKPLALCGSPAFLIMWEPSLPDYVGAPGIPELFFICLAPRWVGELLPLSSFVIFTTTTFLWQGYVLEISLYMWKSCQKGWPPISVRIRPKVNVTVYFNMLIYDLQTHVGESRNLYVFQVQNQPVLLCSISELLLALLWECWVRRTRSKY
jgi:hypothetical protein